MLGSDTPVTSWPNEVLAVVITVTTVPSIDQIEEVSGCNDFGRSSIRHTITRNHGIKSFVIQKAPKDYQVVRPIECAEIADGLSGLPILLSGNAGGRR